MGLYGERVGAFSVVTSSPEEKAKVDSQASSARINCAQTDACVGNVDQDPSPTSLL